MKEHPIVTAYVNYWLRKACRDLKVKRSDYKSINIEYTTRGTVHVWFFNDSGGADYIVYTTDGKRKLERR